MKQEERSDTGFCLLLLVGLPLLVFGLLATAFGIVSMFCPDGQQLGIVALPGMFITVIACWVCHTAWRLMRTGHTPSVSRQSCRRCGSHLLGNPDTCKSCGQQRPLG